jgi:hypothetical protein
LAGLVGSTAAVLATRDTGASDLPDFGRVGPTGGGRMVSHLKLRFDNRKMWEFDVPKSDKKTARAVVAALESPPS